MREIEEATSEIVIDGGSKIRERFGFYSVQKFVEVWLRRSNYLFSKEKFKE